MRKYVPFCETKPLRETKWGLLRLKRANAWVWLCDGMG